MTPLDRQRRADDDPAATTEHHDRTFATVAQEVPMHAPVSLATAIVVYLVLASTSAVEALAIAQFDWSMEPRFGKTREVTREVPGVTRTFPQTYTITEYETSKC